MPDPLRDEAVRLELLEKVLHAAERYLGTEGDRAMPAESLPLAIAHLETIGASGVGSSRAVDALIESALAGATRSGGGRYFDFVIGGSTPAALAADWLVSLLDQNAAGPGSALWATEVEALVLRELVELLGLPSSWSGVLTASSMSATLTGLACATRWWGRAHGADVGDVGLSGLPPMRIFTTELVHPTTLKALQLLGHGRSASRQFGGDGAMRDLEDAVRLHPGPAVVVATAGDASQGSFDPIDQMAEISERHGCWFHIDAAFGVWTRLSANRRGLMDGMERADSVAADAHKWLNVPYESGFCLLSDPRQLEPTFGMPAAPYLPDTQSGFRGFSVLGPDSSRRARSLPIWASLAAYGRDGLADMIDRHLAAAHHLADLIAQRPQLELVAPPQSFVVCLRVRAAESGFHARLAEAIREDGAFSVGCTVVDGSDALRVAICSWRCEPAHMDGLVDAITHQARRLAKGA